MIISRITPDDKVVGLGQAEQTNMKRPREEIFQESEQTMAQILIEKQRHAETATR